MDQLVTESSQMAFILIMLFEKGQISHSGNLFFFPSQCLSNDRIRDQKGRLTRKWQAILPEEKVTMAGSSSDLRGADGGI